MRKNQISLLLAIGIIFFNSCTEENAAIYNEKVDEINSEYVTEKNQLLKKIIVKNFQDSQNIEKSVYEINEMERKYEEKLNELNDLFLGQQIIRPFQIKKTTSIELAHYGIQVGMNVQNRTTFNYILNETINLIIKMIVVAGIIILLGFFVNYSSPLALFKVLFSHWIVFILFSIFSYFLSPAKYFGLIASELENETDKIISLHIEKTENEIKEIKLINIKQSSE